MGFYLGTVYHFVDPFWVDDFQHWPTGRGKKKMPICTIHLKKTCFNISCMKLQLLWFLSKNCTLLFWKSVSFLKIWVRKFIHIKLNSISIYNNFQPTKTVSWISQTSPKKSINQPIFLGFMLLQGGSPASYKWRPITSISRVKCHPSETQLFSAIKNGAP